MFAKIINACVKMVQKYLPEPFIFAILLTILAFVIAIPICQQTPIEAIEHWGNGVWTLLGFAMQMALVLVCGSTLAEAPTIKRGISLLASIPKTPVAAIAIVSVVSAVACWINWGFGLIVGAIFAKEIAKKLRGVDYRLLISSAYSGFIVWHAGLSGSIPLSMTSDSKTLSEITHGALKSPIPLSETVFSPYTIILVVAVIIALAIVNSLMHPKAEKVISINATLLSNDNNDSTPTTKPTSPSEKMENSKVLGWTISLLGLSYLFIHIIIRGNSLDLNSVIMLFLFLGIILHKTPLAYVKAFTKSSTSAAGILLQFPFYAGIMGIIMGIGESGICLGGIISNACIDISTPSTFPILTFLSAGLINIFIPSGGGQWAVQAPIMFPAGANLGVDPAITGMAIAWGDAWTNLIQPFWAIPALAIAKLNAKDIMGFCLINLIISGIIICLGLFIWA